ncbi:MAG: hypothetical protein ACRD2P_15890 [Terriglobia bacterium]
MPSKTLYDQVVVGTGSSALQFLYAAFRGSQTKFYSNSTLVVGKSDRWQQKAGFDSKHSSHAMGQSAAMLRLGDEIPKTGPAEPRFMESRDFSKQSNDLREKIKLERGSQVEFENGQVEKIDGAPPLYTIKLAGSTALVQAKQVIVASGLGSPAALPVLSKNVVHKERLGTQPLLYKEIVDAERFFLTEGIEGLRVLIYGGSATASWAAAHAYLYKPSALIWMCRQGASQVKTDGNPIDRNGEVIKNALRDNIIRQGEIKEVEVIDPPGWNRARLKVTFDKLDQQIYGGNDFIFHQIVYATGSSILASGGPAGILSDGIRNQLEPRWDNNYRYGTDPHDRVVTAYATPDNSLWVIGAAVHHFTNWEAVNVVKQSPDGRMVSAFAGKYSKAWEILPRGGKPPEGIAILTSTINALTGYNWRSGPKGQRDAAKFNWTKADRRETFQFLAEIYGVDIPLSVREKLVDDIIAERKKTPVGLKKSQIESIFRNVRGAQPASSRPYGSRPEGVALVGGLTASKIAVRSSTTIDLGKLKLDQNPTVYADDAKSPHEYLDKQFKS